LGLSYLSDAQSAVLLDCYRTTSPVEEVIKATCRLAYSAAQQGFYKASFKLLETIPPSAHRTLKFHQYLVAYSGLLKLKRALHHGDTMSAEFLLRQLKPSGPIDPELSLHIALLDIEYLMLKGPGSLSTALDRIELLAEDFKSDGDVAQRVHLLTLKAQLFARAGHPLRGFSVAMRAASTSLRARIMPNVWEATGAVANCLLALEEYDAARRMLDSTIPQAIEGGDISLVANLYSLQADAWMGLAGQQSAQEQARQRMKNVSKAEMYIDRALELNTQIDSLRGKCDMLAKKALIAQLRGDVGLAQKYAEEYVAVTEAVTERAENLPVAPHASVGVQESKAEPIAGSTAGRESVRNSRRRRTQMGLGVQPGA